MSVILVTGSAGLIGSETVKHFAAVGYDIVGIDNDMRRTFFGDEASTAPNRVALERTVKAYTHHDLDVRDREGVDGLFSRYGEDVAAVVHTAAQPSHDWAARAPFVDFDVNAVGTLNVLESARRANVRRIVHTSTSEVYGTAQVAPITEQHPIRPQSPYAASKAGADHLVLAYGASFGTPVVVLRPFNTYGPRQSLRAVIPTIAAQLLRGGAVRLGSVHPTRDFTFVSDTVAGFMLAATAPDAVGRTVQLGTGVEISIGDLAKLLGDITGVVPRIETDPDRVRPAASEVERLVADPALARELLGWTPTVDLRAGLQRTVEWLRQSPAGDRAAEYVR